MKNTMKRRTRPIGIWAYLLRGDLRTLLTTPLIYSLAVPIVALDLWVAVFQTVCFRAWRITPVRRRDYFAIDRHRLPYLNAIEKLHCFYCSYVNGVFAYVHEVAARTEQYWCPIRHARPVRGSHARYAAFAPYGDAAAYDRRLPALRAAIKR